MKQKYKGCRFPPGDLGGDKIDKTKRYNNINKPFIIRPLKKTWECSSTTMSV